MNVIIVSLERCGSSWVGAIISEVYQAITGKLIKWNHEISRVLAVDKKYDLPQGWNSVYNVDPQELLDRGYDKVIVIERNLETLKRVFWMSQRIVHGDLSYEKGIKYQKYTNFFETIEKYWNIVYDNKIEDERIFRVSLDEFNNYTFNTFNELFDFLEFPKNRPILIPVNPPERNWQCYSDILAKGHRPSDTLRLIDLRYASNITEAQIQTMRINNKIYDENIPALSNLKYKYANEVNPYKTVEEEVGGQKNRSFRIMIDSMVDVLELMKTPNCELCNKEFEENEDKYSVQEWFVKQRSTTITRCFIVCKQCREEKGEKIIIRDWQTLEPKILDLGCGNAKEKNAYGVDLIEFPEVDYVCNLNETPWVFGGGSSCWDIIYMNDILEHLNNPIDILKETHRILKLNGKLIIKVVYWNHLYTWSDCTHQRGFSEISFKCFVGKGRPLGLDFKFKDLKIEYIYNPRAIEKYGNDPIVLQEKGYWNCNVIQGMIITLIK